MWLDILNKYVMHANIFFFLVANTYILGNVSFFLLLRWLKTLNGNLRHFCISVLWGIILTFIPFFKKVMFWMFAFLNKHFKSLLYNFGFLWYKLTENISEMNRRFLLTIKFSLAYNKIWHYFSHYLYGLCK